MAWVTCISKKAPLMLNSTLSFWSTVCWHPNGIFPWKVFHISARNGQNTFCARVTTVPSVEKNSSGLPAVHTCHNLKTFGDLWNEKYNKGAEINNTKTFHCQNSFSPRFWKLCELFFKEGAMKHSGKKLPCLSSHLFQKVLLHQINKIS